MEDQDRIAGARDLLETPAAIGWACLEPLLGGVRHDAVLWRRLAGGYHMVAARGGRPRFMGRHGGRWTGLSPVVRSVPEPGRLVLGTCGLD